MHFNFYVRARVAARLLGLVVWTVSLFAVRLLAMPLSFAAPRTERAVRTLLFKTWGRGIWKIAGARVRVAGRLPRSPFMLVSNHISYFDIMAYAGLLGCVFVSMVEIGRWPVVGVLSRGMNTIFIDRKRRSDTVRVNQRMAGVFRQGGSILFFPESTTTTGTHVLPFKPALLQTASETMIPVHYATIRYTTALDEAPAAYAICWVDDTPFHAHVLRMLRLSAFDVEVCFGDEALVDEDRKRLAARLHEAVSRQLDPMVR